MSGTVGNEQLQSINCWRENQELRGANTKLSSLQFPVTVQNVPHLWILSLSLIINIANIKGSRCHHCLTNHISTHGCTLQKSIIVFWTCLMFCAWTCVLWVTSAQTSGKQIRWCTVCVGAWKPWNMLWQHGDQLIKFIFNFILEGTSYSEWLQKNQIFFSIIQCTSAVTT